MVRKVLGMDLVLCPEAMKRHGHLSKTSSNLLPLNPTVSLAATGLVMRVPATMSRWFTTELSTVTCNSFARYARSQNPLIIKNSNFLQAYDIMKRGLGLSAKEMGEVFDKWNKGVLDSFLIEITRDILKYDDGDEKTPLVDKVLDSAGQKGTGKWTAINALDLGMPVTLIGEAVFARCLSSLKKERGRAAGLLEGPTPKFTGDKAAFLTNLEQALYASKIISYAQGFMLIQNVSKLGKLMQ